MALLFGVQRSRLTGPELRVCQEERYLSQILQLTLLLWNPVLGFQRLCGGVPRFHGFRIHFRGRLSARFSLHLLGERLCAYRSTVPHRAAVCVHVELYCFLQLREFGYLTYGHHANR